MVRLECVVVLFFVLGCGPQVFLPGEEGSEGGSSGSSGDVPESRPGSGPGMPPATTGVPIPDPEPGGSTTWPGTPDDGESGSTSTFPATTGTPTTAGTGGGEPGGAGPGATPDDADDVDLPSADVVAAAVYTDGSLVDFRVQLAAPPFTDEATYNITWCIEAGLGGGRSCATHAYDIDHYLQLFQAGPAGDFVSATPEVDPCLHGAFESDTNTLRILVPADEFPGTPDFRWILTVTFGGSGGDNEWVPEMGNLDVVWVDELPPFAGEPTC